MNDLTIFLYVATVVDNLQGTLAFLLFIIAVGMLLSGVGWAVNATSSFKEDRDVSAQCKGILKMLAYPACAAIFLLVFIPDKNTMYAMAASEFGEELAKTETATLAHKALNKWLKEQVGEDRP